MNWYFLLKQAEPHQIEQCPNKDCHTEFFVDLLWERNKNTHHTVGTNGRPLNSEQIAAGEPIAYEWSNEQIMCPNCGTTWYSTFKRFPRQSGNTTESVRSVGEKPAGSHSEYDIPAIVR